MSDYRNTRHVNIARDGSSTIHKSNTTSTWRDKTNASSSPCVFDNAVKDLSTVLEESVRDERHRTREFLNKHQEKKVVQTAPTSSNGRNSSSKLNEARPSFRNNESTTNDLSKIGPRFEMRSNSQWVDTRSYSQNNNNIVNDFSRSNRKSRSRGPKKVARTFFQNNNNNNTVYNRSEMAQSSSPKYDNCSHCDEALPSSENGSITKDSSVTSTDVLLTLQDEYYEGKYNRRELADYWEDEDYYQGCFTTPDVLSDLATCPPWKSEPDDTRSIIDFINQFWDNIGQFINDPFLRLIRFNIILDASPETRFLTYDIKEYIESSYIGGGKPEFSNVEKMLRSIFWPAEVQMEIAREFAASRYDRNDDKKKTKHAYVTFWYCKLMQINPFGPEDPLQALADKMPEQFTRWVRKRFSRNRPDSICELCVWIRTFDMQCEGIMGKELRDCQEL